ncbi:hypothetical protein SLE2022_364320 [Rubroshorea leprosula]
MEIGGECIVLLPNNLEALGISDTKIMRSNFNKAALLEKATELRECYILYCEGIECVVDLDSSSPSSSLWCPLLNKLEVFCLRDCLACVNF